MNCALFLASKVLASATRPAIRRLNCAFMEERVHQVAATNEASIIRIAFLVPENIFLYL